MIKIGIKCCSINITPKDTEQFNRIEKILSIYDLPIQYKQNNNMCDIILIDCRNIEQKALVYDLMYMLSKNDDIELI